MYCGRLLGCLIKGILSGGMSQCRVWHNDVSVRILNAILCSPKTMHHHTPHAKILLILNNQMSSWWTGLIEIQNWISLSFVYPMSVRTRDMNHPLSNPVELRQVVSHALRAMCRWSPRHVLYRPSVPPKEVTHNTVVVVVAILFSNRYTMHILSKHDRCNITRWWLSGKCSSHLADGQILLINDTEASSVNSQFRLHCLL